MGKTAIKALDVLRAWQYLVRITGDEELKITQYDQSEHTYFQLFRGNREDGSVHHEQPPMNTQCCWYYLRGRIDAVEERQALKLS